MLLAYFEVDAGQPLAITVDVTYVLIEEFYLKLRKTLITLIKTVITLLQPFKCPGSDDLLNPSLYVIVLAHVTLVHCTATQVMIQGSLVTRHNFDRFLETLKTELDRIETLASKGFSDVIQQPWHHRLTMCNS